MTSKNPILQKYNTLSKIYNQIWIVVIVLAIGLLIMQIASGNLTGSNDKIQVSEFNCYQTPDKELVGFKNYEPQTNTDLSIIEFNQIIKTKLKVNEIPPINNPKFTQNHSEVLKCLDENEKGILIENRENIRIYPFTILQQHLIVNDKIEEKPVLISYCALCNSPNVYERTLDDKILTFGTTGLLYRNNDLFYDDLSDSLWSQLNGKAIVGDSVGQSLTPLNFKIVKIKEFIETHPKAYLMTFDTGSKRNYADTTFTDYAKSPKTLSAVINSSEEFKPKDIVFGFKIEDKSYAINSENAEKENFSVKTPDETIIKSISEDGSIRLIVNDQEIQYIQSYWYVWYDHYPETIALKP